MSTNNDKPLPEMNDLVVENKNEENPEESNFELYLMKKSKLKNEKLEYRKLRAERISKDAEGYTQDSAYKPVVEEKAAAPKPQIKHMESDPRREVGATSSVPQNFIDVPDYGFIAIDGSYQAPF